MGAKERASALHGEGFNCAQSVLGALGYYTGLNENMALALTGGFGGGVNCGEICGTVSAAVMALGLAFPYTDGDDSAARAKIRKLSMVYAKAFTEKFGCIRCFDLKRSGHLCPQLIEYATELAEKMIQENQ